MFSPSGFFLTKTTALLVCLCWVSQTPARDIEWSGHVWEVRTSNGAPQGPGPNVFSDGEENVFVDEDGLLHLRIVQQADGRWTAAEVRLKQSLSFGTYRWEVASRYDTLAKNVVVGLFTYLDPQEVEQQTPGAVGNGVADTPHEIDIEFTGAWGDGRLHFTTHDPDVASPHWDFFQPLESGLTTHEFTWEPTRIHWQSFLGHAGAASDGLTPIREQRPGDRQGEPARVTYEGPVIPRDLNEVPIINFWMFGKEVSERGPSDGTQQEILFKSFHYEPLEQ